MTSHPPIDRLRELEERATPSENLVGLAERIEALDGPSREVVKEIFRSCFPELVPSPIVSQGYGWREDESGWWLATGEDARTPPQTIYPPNYLGSLDAATSIMPENAMYRSGHTAVGLIGMYFCDVVTVDGGDFHAMAVTEPNARLAAALRARSAQ